MGARLKILLMGGVANAAVAEIYSRDASEGSRNPVEILHETLMEAFGENVVVGRDEGFKEAWEYCEENVPREGSRGG